MLLVLLALLAVGRSALGTRLDSKSTLERRSVCSSEMTWRCPAVGCTTTLASAAVSPSRSGLAWVRLALGSPLLPMVCSAREVRRLALSIHWTVSLARPATVPASE